MQYLIYFIATLPALTTFITALLLCLMALDEPLWIILGVFNAVSAILLLNRIDDIVYSIIQFLKELANKL